MGHRAMKSFISESPDRSRGAACSVVRHSVMGPVAIGLLALCGWLYDAVMGSPQATILTRPVSQYTSPGGEFEMVYDSVKDRDCPMQIERWLYRLDEGGTRVPDGQYPVGVKENVGPTGLAHVGFETETLTLLIPRATPPGSYEYQATIHRQCVPWVGRNWRIIQQAVPITILPDTRDN